MNSDQQVAKRISSLCGKLKSAWSLLIGFEVIQFLVQHLEFTERWFSSPKLSQTITCRGRRATVIIATLNSWMPVEYQQTPFIDSLWDTLRANPSFAFRAECPVSCESLPENKIHRKITQLLRTYNRVLHEDGDLGFSLRQADSLDDTIISLQVPGWRHSRIMSLSAADKKSLASGEMPASHLFHRYSSHGALVAFPHEVILNGDELENKFAAKAIRKLKKREMIAKKNP